MTSGNLRERLPELMIRDAVRLGRRLDLRGLALLSPGLAIFVYGMSEAGSSGGFGAGRTLAGVALGLALVALFGWHAWLDVQMLRREAEALLKPAR